LVDLEARHDLLRHQVDGWCVWPLFRFHVGALALGGGVASRAGIDHLTRLRLVGGDLAGLARLPRSPVAALVYASNRSEHEGGRAKDAFLDDLLRAIAGREAGRAPSTGGRLGASGGRIGAAGDRNAAAGVKIEHVDNPVFVARRRGALLPAALTTTFFGAAASALARSAGPPAIRHVAGELHAALAAGLGDPDRLPRATIALALRRFYWLRRLYGAVLARVRPRHLLVVTAYANHAAVAAAKGRGIAVVELQHGVVDRHHAGYDWSATARPYKPRLPIPDRLFLYGRYFRDELTAGGFWDEELRVVGSPRVDAYRRRREPPATSSQWSPRDFPASHELHTPDDPATPSAPLKLVLTTQGWDVARLVAFMAETLDRARGVVPPSLTVKLHPGETSPAPYASLARYPGVTISPASEPPSTFELLVGADVHLSISSSCHYEALALGVPTIVLALDGHGAMAPLCEAGHAALVATPAELLEILRAGRQGGPDVAAAAGQWYFEPNALANMLRELGYG